MSPALGCVYEERHSLVVAFMCAYVASQNAIDAVVRPDEGLVNTTFTQKVSGPLDINGAAVGIDIPILSDINF